MTDNDNTKYGGMIEDHEWTEEDDTPEEPDATSISMHVVEVVHTFDPDHSHADMGYGRYKYDVHLSHKDRGTVALQAKKNNWKGNFWRQTERVDWRDLPSDVHEAVANAVNTTVEELDPGHRLIDEGGEEIRL